MSVHNTAVSSKSRILADKNIEKTEQTKKQRGRRCKVVLQFIEHFPDENPVRTVEDITQVLSYIGIFDGIRKVAP